ncbi:L,D-transpeptidase family protein [Dysgonomonas sp. 520]|uniref:L,D-transpeptidase family protein n=1 Tax=Dysgonomonas sp. 520 TaxID=2302931 RepID=UPI0013D6F030|nr:L,D-transpeptidase family protein [Dysgonomonas sp. 520]NDW08850.1 L,D-transpeptidase [Dysgonomonas sp. 520]
MKHWATLLLFLTLGISISKATETTGNNGEINLAILNDSLAKYISTDNRLKHLYQENSNQHLWIGQSFDKEKFKPLIEILSNSKQHGLPSDLFNKTRIEQIVDSLSENKYPKEKYYEALAQLEFLSTKASIDYVKALKFGYTNPKKIMPNDYFIDVVQPDSLYFSYINKLVLACPIKAMMKSEPKGEMYVKMQNKLIAIDSLSSVKLETIVPKAGDASYKLNDENVNIGRIVDRLVLTGNYTYTGTDSLKNILTKDLLDAVNKFRRENSYHEDDEIGKTTIEVLNRPLSYYMKKLQANLERQRWRRKKVRSDRRVEVNVAPFRLFAYDKNEVALQMIVCVGTVANRTPLMESDINIVNMNPVWNVPRSITQKELYHSIKKDPNYLKRRNMTMSQGGKAVDPASIDWSKTSSSTFNYSISQGAGSGNSLGRVKFLFPNRFSVYLHDTPSQSAFLRKNRAVSHGCVRLEKPIDFTQYCMSKLDDKLYKDQILYTIERSPESEEGKRKMKDGSLKKLPNVINLSKTIPVTLDYHTVFAMPAQSSLYFADDVYGHDNTILRSISL